MDMQSARLRNMGYLELAMARILAISREAPNDRRAADAYKLLAEVWTWLQQEQ